MEAITKKTAEILLANNIEVFALFSDGSESAIEDKAELARFEKFGTEAETFKVWGYSIRKNEIWGEWHVSNEDVGTIPFKNIDQAVDEADRGTLKENKS